MLSNFKKGASHVNMGDERYFDITMTVTPQNNCHARLSWSVCAPIHDVQGMPHGLFAFEEKVTS